ncbi:MAG: hypothetical protein EBZ40_10640, partial [Gammaproteobacteria bacterium]|nr:hypothetical protein [Gammaproteobacteria bacterium]
HTASWAPNASVIHSNTVRAAMPGRRIEVNLGGGNFKAQFRRADRSGAALALVLGEDELARGIVQLKPLRDEAASATEISLAAAGSAVANWFEENAR